MKKTGTYAAILERIFESKYRRGMREVDFEREDIVRCASELKIALPKNLGDVVYSFRYRAALPETIQKSAGKGYTWIIRGVGTARYPPRISRRDSPHS